MHTSAPPPRPLPGGTPVRCILSWVTAAGIPLVPLGAYLIQPIHEENTYGRHTASFTVLERPPPAPQRVVRTCLLLVVELLPLVLGLVTDVLDRTVGNGPAGFFVMLACIVWAGYVVFIRIKNDGKVYKPLPPRRVAA